MKNRERKTWCIIDKNGVLSIIDPFYFLIIVKNGVLLKLKISSPQTRPKSFLKLSLFNGR